MVAVLISAAFRDVAFIRGRPLFQCGYPKVRRLLAGGAYLRRGAYQRAALIRGNRVLKFSYQTSSLATQALKRTY